MIDGKNLLGRCVLNLQVCVTLCKGVSVQDAGRANSHNSGSWAGLIVQGHGSIPRPLRMCARADPS